MAAPPPGGGKSAPSVTAPILIKEKAFVRGDSSLTREPLKRFAAKLIQRRPSGSLVSNANNLRICKCFRFTAG